MYSILFKDYSRSPLYKSRILIPQLWRNGNRSSSDKPTYSIQCRHLRLRHIRPQVEVQSHAGYQRRNHHHGGCQHSRKGRGYGCGNRMGTSDERRCCSHPAADSFVANHQHDHLCDLLWNWGGWDHRQDVLRRV